MQRESNCLLWQWLVCVHSRSSALYLGLFSVFFWFRNRPLKESVIFHMMYSFFDGKTIPFLLMPKRMKSQNRFVKRSENHICRLVNHSSFKFFFLHSNGNGMQKLGLTKAEVRECCRFSSQQQSKEEIWENQEFFSTHGRNKICFM